MTDSAPAPIVDNPTPWVAKQIEEYLETDGARPVFRHNSPLLLLTVKGRTSGQWRRTALIYGRDGDRLIIVASLGGAPEHPVWYRNLVENPRVWLQVGAQTFWATARTATDADRYFSWRT